MASNYWFNEGDNNQQNNQTPDYWFNSDDTNNSTQQPQGYQGTWLENAGQAIPKIIHAIDQPGEALGFQQPQTNDLDASSPLSDIGNAFDKAGGLVATKLGQSGYPKTGAALGTLTAATNPALWAGAPPGASMPDVPLPGAGISQNTAQNLGRRALGINKGMLNRMPGGVDQANQAAQTMLDQGVIGPSTSNTLDRAKQALDQSGSIIGTILKRSGQNALDTNEVASNVIDQLAPNFPAQGAYGKQDALTNEIVDTIMAHGSGPIDFDSANQLKQTLKENAGANWNTDKLRAAAYQKAYGIVNQAMEDGINKAEQAGTIPQGMLPLYKQQKSVYGASKMAVEGLEDKANAEAANSILSLRGAAIGAGALAAGHVTPALEALGVWEAARRGGSGFGAPIANYLAKASVPSRAAMAAKLLAQNQSYNK
jgi:hypothetical protein